MHSLRNSGGIVAAGAIILAWLVSLLLLLSSELTYRNPLSYLLILVQTHLYTGLFITAHDAMHGTVSADRRVNDLVGWVCTLLYAAFSFSRLRRKHHEHHRHVHSDKDPDYHDGNFAAWYFSFIKEYITWVQLIAMALIFNVLKIWFDEQNLLLFWVVPALLSTLQLFYFGTWLPHHGEHDNIHNSRTLPKNHILAFFSCYFFGYHFEHHESPGVPWWKLWRTKN